MRSELIQDEASAAGPDGEALTAGGRNLAPLEGRPEFLSGSV
ncbi:hypothetical protein [Kribbella sp. NPDC051770]